jgi:hypothetical protein
MKYFYLDKTNQPVGPCTEEEIRQLHREGTLNDNSMIVGKGETEWKSYASMFPAPLMAVPPVIKAATSNEAPPIFQPSLPDNNISPVRRVLKEVRRAAIATLVIFGFGMVGLMSRTDFESAFSMILSPELIDPVLTVGLIASGVVWAQAVNKSNAKSQVKFGKWALIFFGVVFGYVAITLLVAGVFPESWDSDERMFRTNMSGKALGLYFVWWLIAFIRRKLASKRAQ